MIQVLIYISTAYTNIDKKVIEEKIYPPHGDWVKLIRAAEKTDHFTLDILAKKITGSLGNNYVFSKSLAEHVVGDMCRGKVPAIIVRPSIGKSACD